MVLLAVNPFSELMAGTHLTNHVTNTFSFFYFHNIPVASCISRQVLSTHSHLCWPTRTMEVWIKGCDPQDIHLSSQGTRINKQIEFCISHIVYSKWFHIQAERLLTNIWFNPASPNLGMPREVCIRSAGPHGARINSKTSIKFPTRGKSEGQQIKHSSRYRKCIFTCTLEGPKVQPYHSFSRK